MQMDWVMKDQAFCVIGMYCNDAGLKKSVETGWKPVIVILGVETPASDVRRDVNSVVYLTEMRRGTRTSCIILG